MPDGYYFGCETRILIHKNRLIIAGLVVIEAINKNSGKIEWSYSAKFDGDCVFNTSNPIIYKDNLIIGIKDGYWDEDYGLGGEDYIEAIDTDTGKNTFREIIDFELKGNPGILNNKLYCWDEDTLIEISLSL
jgi:hypothetical protein